MPPPISEPAVILRETLLAMQVCRANDITDDEALDHVGRYSGTSDGWVPMTQEDRDRLNKEQNTAYLLHEPCEDDPSRVHFLAVC